jgi:hypothetical protein
VASFDGPSVTAAVIIAVTRSPAASPPGVCGFQPTTAGLLELS